MSHIAELNVAYPRFPLDDPRIAEFIDALDRVNAVAERSPGFVWRLAGTADDAIDMRLPGRPGAIVNLSVWQDIEALEAFVHRTVHRRFLARRAEWFEALSVPTFVMWRVAEGHRPGLDEAADRLALLERDGPGETVFTWSVRPASEARITRFG